MVIDYYDVNNWKQDKQVHQDQLQGSYHPKMKDHQIYDLEKVISILWKLIKCV